MDQVDVPDGLDEGAQNEATHQSLHVIVEPDPKQEPSRQPSNVVGHKVDQNAPGLTPSPLHTSFKR